MIISQNETWISAKRKLSMTDNTLLITGGCGFIGTSLIEHLVLEDSSRSIRVLDNFSHGTPQDLAEITDFKTATAKHCHQYKGIVLVEGDIRDMATVLRCTKGVTGIVHLAANTGVGPSVKEPRLDMECNVIGTFNLLDAARLNGVKRFVFASSGAPVGEVDPPIHEEIAPHPVSPYGASKLAGEGYCSAYSRTFGIHTVCLRFGNVYGPRSKKKSSVVAKFIRQALAGQICEIYGDGNQTRDFIYITDLVKAIAQALKFETGGEIFQIATGMERTVLEVAQLISDELHKNTGIEMKLSYGSARTGDVRRNFSDTTKAQNLLGWEMNTNIKEGISATIDYFQKLTMNVVEGD
jgi:UDP-glucose 4-epimerase